MTRLWLTIRNRPMALNAAIEAHRISEIIEGTSRGAQDTAKASLTLSETGESLGKLVVQFKLS